MLYRKTILLLIIVIFIPYILLKSSYKSRVDPIIVANYSLSPSLYRDDTVFPIALWFIIPWWEEYLYQNQFSQWDVTRTMPQNK